MKRFLMYCVPVLFMMFFVASCEKCEECTPAAYLEEPANIIPVKQAKEMYDTYSYRQAVLKTAFRNLQEIPGIYEAFEELGLPPVEPFDYDPTRYVEYSLDDMKHYIAYIENEAKKADVKIEGIRIFLGAYPNSDTFEHSGEEIPFPRQESIALTPTAMNEGEAQAFFIRNGQPVFMKGLGDELYEIDGTGNKSSGKQQASIMAFSSLLQDDISLTMNHGNLRPPPNGDDDYSGDK